MTKQDHIGSLASADVQMCLFPFLDPLLAESPVYKDPPDHASYRALVEKAFTPSYARSLEPCIETLIDELIDGILPAGKANLLPEFAIKVPMYIIADQLGVDRADYDRFNLSSDVTVESRICGASPRRTAGSATPTFPKARC